MPETPTNKKTVLERELQEVTKGLKSVTQKIETSLPKQESGFFKIAESIKEANETSEKVGKKFSDEGKLFNNQLEDIVNTAKTASRQDLVVQRKRLNEILSTIKDTVADEEERKVILDNFDLVKKQIQGNISFQKQIFGALQQGISKQVTDGIAIIGSIAAENPLVGFVFQNIVGLTGSIFSAIKEKRAKDKEIAVADLKQIKERQEQTVSEKKKLIEDEKISDKEEKEKPKKEPIAKEKKEPIVKPKKEELITEPKKDDNLVIDSNEDGNKILVDIKKETSTTNELLKSLNKVFFKQQKQDFKTKSIERARKSELVLEKKISDRKVFRAKSIVKPKIPSKGGGFFGLFGVNLSKIIPIIVAVLFSPIILGIVGALIAGGLGFVFKDQLKKLFSDESGSITGDLKESFDKFVGGFKKLFKGDITEGLKDSIGSLLSSSLNAFARSVSRFLSSFSFLMDEQTAKGIEEGKKFELFSQKSLDEAGKKIDTIFDFFKGLVGDSKELKLKNNLKDELGPLNKKQPFKSSLRGVPFDPFNLNKKIKANDKKSTDNVLELLFQEAGKLSIKSESIAKGLLETGATTLNNIVRNLSINQQTVQSINAPPIDSTNRGTDTLR